MGKRSYYLSLLLFTALLGLFFTSISVSERNLYSGIAWAQGTERETQDSHYIQLMRQLRIKVDGWLKDLNQRIEKEDVTRFEVRFLEILRSFLEWVREKIDAQIEAGEQKPKKRTRGEDI